MIFGRTVQIAKLRHDINIAATHARQSNVAMADIVLALLQSADELCELAADTGADMKKLSGVMIRRRR
jgi:hypothetical protein